MRLLHKRAVAGSYGFAFILVGDGDESGGDKLEGMGAIIDLAGLSSYTRVWTLVREGNYSPACCVRMPLILLVNRQ